jgi:hypothetical protein
MLLGKPFQFPGTELPGYVRAPSGQRIPIRVIRSIRGFSSQCPLWLRGEIFPVAQKYLLTKLSKSPGATGMPVLFMKPEFGSSFENRGPTLQESFGPKVFDISFIAPSLQGVVRKYTGKPVPPSVVNLPRVQK